MMHSAIVVVVMPAEHHTGKMAWQNFSALIAGTLENPAVQTLGYNIWQVDFRASPNGLAQLVAAAEKFGFPYRILPFDAEPQWIRVNPTKEGK